MFTDGSLRPSGRERNGSLISRARPLHFGVPSKLKEAIWNDKYVEFLELLGQSAEVQSATFSSDGRVDPITISFGRASKGKQLSIMQWSSAFHIFCAIYAMKQSEALPKLVQYGSLVKEISREGGDWRYYDETFRR